jgi:hypothetical protein
MSNDIGIALHIELAIVCMCDSEAEALVESPSGIDSYYIQTYCKIERSGFANQSVHHLRADALALKPAVHKHLRDKKFIIFPDGLHPAYIGTVEHYDTNLRRVPLLPEAGFLSGAV